MFFNDKIVEDIIMNINRDDQRKDNQRGYFECLRNRFKSHHGKCKYEPYKKPESEVEYDFFRHPKTESQKFIKC